MRHNVVNLMGLGNPEPCELDNNIKLDKSKFWDSFLIELQKSYPIFSNFDGFDFHLAKNGFAFGIEPSYQFDELLIVYIDFYDKNNSYIERGFATGFYGSNCVSKTKFYKDYKRKSKFIRFVDEWYQPLLDKLKEYENEQEKQN